MPSCPFRTHPITGEVLQNQECHEKNFTPHASHPSHRVSLYVYGFGLIGTGTTPENPSSLSKEIVSGKGEYRAVSFPAYPENSVGGKVKKGDSVDVIATFRDPMGNHLFTKTIMQGVKVMDVTGSGKDIRAIILEVTLRQAEIIRHAYASGDVAYALNPAKPILTPTFGIGNQFLPIEPDRAQPSPPPFPYSNDSSVDKANEFNIDGGWIDGETNEVSGEGNG